MLARRPLGRRRCSTAPTPRCPRRRGNEAPQRSGRAVEARGSVRSPVRRAAGPRQSLPRLLRLTCMPFVHASMLRRRSSSAVVVAAPSTMEAPPPTPPQYSVGWNWRPGWSGARCATCCPDPDATSRTRPVGGRCRPRTSAMGPRFRAAAGEKLAPCVGAADAAERSPRSVPAVSLALSLFRRAPPAAALTGGTAGGGCAIPASRTGLASTRPSTPGIRPGGRVRPAGGPRPPGAHTRRGCCVREGPPRTEGLTAPPAPPPLPHTPRGRERGPASPARARTDPPCSCCPRQESLRPPSRTWPPVKTRREHSSSSSPRLNGGLLLPPTWQS